MFFDTKVQFNIQQDGQILTLHSLGGAEERSGRWIEAKRCLSVSEFFSPRLARAPQGIQRFALDTDTGGSVFGDFFRRKSHSQKPAQPSGEIAFDFKN